MNIRTNTNYHIQIDINMYGHTNAETYLHLLMYRNIAYRYIKIQMYERIHVLIISCCSHTVIPIC